MRNVAQGKFNVSTLKAADGRTVQIVNKPLAQGGWVATIEDITERRNLEQERDRNFKFLRQIIDHIPTQITVKDARDGRYVLANRVAETQFGLPRDAIVGKTALDLFPKASADIIAASDEKALQSPDGLFLNERPWQSQALGRRFITSRRIGIPDQSGAMRYIINVIDDVDDIAHRAGLVGNADAPRGDEATAQRLALPRPFVQEQAVGGLQGLFIARGDDIGGRLRKQVEGCLADDGIARQSELSLGHTVGQDVAAIARILDGDLCRDVVDDLAQE